MVGNGPGGSNTRPNLFEISELGNPYIDVSEIHEVRLPAEFEDHKL